MTFSQQVLAGLAAGVMTGLFFGERTAALDMFADGFVKLLQMTVLPYVTLSIVGSLGALDYAQARALGLRVGAVVIGLWVIALGFAFLIPFAFPTFENASFFSTSLIQSRPPFDVVSLYIPSNPFYSLANNIVPAVVLFSVVLGVALIGVERRQLVLDILLVLRDAVSRVTRFVTRLTPVGLFAIAATAAGTLNPEQLGRLQIYLLAYVSISLLLSLWVLPGLVAALTPIPATALLRQASTPLTTAFVAGDLFIVLPSLIDDSKRLLQKYGVRPDATRLPDVIVPASFNFPHTGKLLSVSFILFAGWFSDMSLAIGDYPRLALSALVTFFGSLNVAVPFLLDLFRIPADTFQLFLATGVINSRFGTLLAAVHTLTVALLGTCAVAGMITWQPRRIMRFVAATAIIAMVVLGGGHALFATVLTPQYRKDEVLAGMNLLTSRAGVAVRWLDAAAAEPPSAASTLAAIRSRGALRVGVLQDSLPYAFVNQRGDLVGLDIDLAYRLAGDLGVGLELVHVSRDRAAAFINDGRCDLVMSGVVVTPLRAGEMLLSDSYLDETLGLLVRDADRERFSSWRGLADGDGLTVGVANAPYFANQIRELLPRATLRTFASAEEIFAAGPGAFDAVALPAERGSAWTLLHPQFSMVVPEGALVKVPLAYPIARRDAMWATFVNTWIELKRKDGTLQMLIEYWVHGHNATPARPRWSIVRDVLHWLP
jgi:Na+/H+-dicarboxylate symporter/ABC-type amino acid transport substrate-binding protein